MNIVKSLVVPAIGLSFLLGGVAAFAGHDGDHGWGKDKDVKAQHGMKYLVGDHANGDENDGDGDSWGSADGQGASTYLIGGDHKEDKSANVQLVAHHDGSSTDNSGTDNDDGENDASGAWLV